MIKRVLAAVLGCFGLCLPLMAQQADHLQPVDRETITLEQLQGTGAVDVAPALALYEPDSFSMYEVKSAYILGGVGNEKVQISAGAAYEEASGHLPSMSH